MSQTSCPWEHDCARGEDDGRPHRAILGKSFRRHDLVRRVCRASSNMVATEESYTNVLGASLSQGAPLTSWSVCASGDLESRVTCVSRTGLTNRLYVGCYWKLVA